MMVIKNVKYVTMNGNIVRENEPIRKVESDFDESNVLEATQTLILLRSWGILPGIYRKKVTTSALILCFSPLMRATLLSIGQ